jgi:cbb3-type cytochrome oxidase subunit 3
VSRGRWRRIVEGALVLLMVLVLLAVVALAFWRTGGGGPG